MVSYNQFKLTLDEDKSLEEVLRKINDLKGQVVVNIVNNPKEAPVFFSLENLEAALSFKKNVLVLETLPEEQYRQIMIREIEMVNDSSAKLRLLLRDQFIDDVKEHVKMFMEQLQNVILLLSCYSLQNPESALSKNMEALSIQLKELNTACLKSRDNVKIMDDLQYLVVPTLQAMIHDMQAE